jgi:hypothetical protein
MAIPKLRKKGGKLKPHLRSHISGNNRFKASKNLGFVDSLARQAKRLEKVLRRERAAIGQL